MVQNAEARLVLKLPKGSSTAEALKTLRWLPIHKRILFKILTIISKAIRKKGPKYLRSRIRSYITQRLLLSSSTNLLAPPPFHLISKGGTSMAVLGTKAWNSLPIQLRLVQSEQMFKKTSKNLDLCCPRAYCTYYLSSDPVPRQCARVVSLHLRATSLSASVKMLLGVNVVLYKCPHSFRGP